jgi:hypothetical protein
MQLKTTWENLNFIERKIGLKALFKKKCRLNHALAPQLLSQQLKRWRLGG